MITTWLTQFNFLNGASVAAAGTPGQLGGSFAQTVWTFFDGATPAGAVVAGPGQLGGSFAQTVYTFFVGASAVVPVVLPPPPPPPPPPLPPVPVPKPAPVPVLMATGVPAGGSTGAAEWVYFGKSGCRKKRRYITFAEALVMADGDVTEALFLMGRKKCSYWP